MNQKIVVGGVIILLLVGGAYFFYAKPADAPTVPRESADKQALENEGAETENKQGLLDFLTTRGAAECTITSKEGTYTVKTDGKRARIDGIEVPATDPKAGMTRGTMINDGQYVYMWSGNQGMKIDMTSATENAPQGAPATDPKDWKSWAQSLETSGVTYDCDAATVSQGDFTPPATVQFTDLSQLMRQIPKDMKAVMPNQGSVPNMPSFDAPTGMPTQQ